MERVLSLFFSLDKRSIALCRILVGCVLLGDLWDRYLSFESHYSNSVPGSLFSSSSVLSNYQEEEKRWPPSAYFWVESDFCVRLLMLFYASSCFFVLFGFWTTTFTFVSWYLNLSLQQRNPQVYYGYDCTVRVLLFYGIFLDWGSFFSLDYFALKLSSQTKDKKQEIVVPPEETPHQLHKRKSPEFGEEKRERGRERRKKEKGDEMENQKVEKDEKKREKEEKKREREERRRRRRWEVLSGGGIALTIQIMLIYIITFSRKISRGGGHQWKSGSALELTLQLDGFVSKYAPILLSIVPSSVLRISTWGALYWELLGPFLLVIPFQREKMRLLCVIGFFSLHISIFTFLRVGFFPLISMASFSLFLPSSFWERVSPFLSRLFSLLLSLFPSSFVSSFSLLCLSLSSFQESCFLRVDEFVRYLGIYNYFHFHHQGRKGDEEEGKRNEEEKGEEKNGEKGRRERGERERGERGERERGERRERGGRFRKSSILKFKNWFPVFCICLSFGFMVHDLTPKFLFPLVYSLRLDQRWMMFAPPPTSSSFLVIEGLLSDGSVVTLYTDRWVDKELVPLFIPPAKETEGKGLFGMNFRSHRYVRFTGSLLEKHWLKKETLELACWHWPEIPSNISTPPSLLSLSTSSLTDLPVFSPPTSLSTNNKNNKNKSRTTRIRRVLAEQPEEGKIEEENEEEREGKERGEGERGYWKRHSLKREEVLVSSREKRNKKQDLKEEEREEKRDEKREERREEKEEMNEVKEVKIVLMKKGLRSPRDSSMSYSSHVIYRRKC